MKQGFICILINKNNTVLYVGVTSSLVERMKEHRTKKYSGSFSARYNLHKLVYWESFASITEAIAREKQLKAGIRQKKIELIERANPKEVDLFAYLVYN